jgi:hypothetical protein
MNNKSINNNGNGGEGNGNLNGNRFRVVESEDKEAVLALCKRLGYLEGLVESQDRLIEAKDKLIATLERVLLAFERTLEGLKSGPQEKCAESAPASPSAATTTRPMPKADKTLDSAMLCNELVRVLLHPDVIAVLNGGVSPQFWMGNRKNEPRVYLDDYSFLFFNHGRIVASADGKLKKKTSYRARYVLSMFFQLEDALAGISPILVGVLAKSHFNAACLEAEELEIEREARTKSRWEVEADHEIEVARKAKEEEAK